MLEKTLESPLDCKEIQPVHSEGDQPWDFFGRNDAMKSLLPCSDSSATPSHSRYSHCVLPCTQRWRGGGGVALRPTRERVCSVGWPGCFCRPHDTLWVKGSPLFRPSRRNRGLPLRRRRGQGPHLAKSWEPRGFSRVAAAFSSYDGDLSLPLGLALGP